MINRRATTTVIVGLGVAGLASGCLSSGSTGNSNNSGSASAGPGKTTVSVMYGLGPDTEPGFKADVKKWAAANGITVNFIKAGSWDTEIRTKVQGGNPPDVGLFPQPGLMCDPAKQGKLVAFVPRESADAVLAAMRAHPLGSDAAIIGDIRALADLGVTAIDFDFERPTEAAVIAEMRAFKERVLARV